MKGSIQLKGVRVNNLKNIDVEIPRNKMVVITGLSGSGKSSLAFDTLYAEGQRRFVESLSAYTRQFLSRMNKPECDFIKELPPAIAIDQKVISKNPRSTVGTSTEIYDYLRLLFARIGRTYSPISGQEVRRHSVMDVIDCIKNYSEGTRFTILAPVNLVKGRTLKQQLEIELKQGITRIDIDGELHKISDILEDEKYNDLKAEQIYLLIDRMSVSYSKDFHTRLADSSETAFFEGNGFCSLRFFPSKILQHFSIRFEADGMTFTEPNDHMFAFNSSLGACPNCEGYGQVLGIDEHLVIPNTSISIYDDAVMCWRGAKMKEWKEMFCREAAKEGFPIFEPYYKLTNSQKAFLWHGKNRRAGQHGKEDICIDNFFDMVKANQYKIQYRVMLARYRGKTICPVCRGTRLREEANYVKIGEHTISELVELPLDQLYNFFSKLQLSESDAQSAKRLLAEIKSRIRFLLNVGLGYLCLNRRSNTLSGGESQRIRLATSLGSSLVGSVYILDEPSIGLHSRDTKYLIKVLHDLRDLGNTVVVVEHDEEIIRAADYIIDIGPEAGRLGGEVVYKGDMKDLKKGSNSHTVHYLLGEEQIAVPSSRRSWNHCIEIKGARHNNLKGINVKFPLNILSVITGVSGSGKSTLVRDILYYGVKRALDEVAERPGEFTSLNFNKDHFKRIDFINQNPIGKSSRSNAAIYVGAYDEIRKLMASLPLSKQMGYTASHFSFNSEGGRCEECKGEGVLKVEMQFMADIVLKCEACHGKRFKKEILEVEFMGKNIYDILNMTVNEAIEFFNQNKNDRIVNKLLPLQEVGLGYIKLGQSSSTLSGGENQRVKLAYYLANKKIDPTVFIFDEPTTGLHFHDIKKLMKAFNALIELGHTIIVIEHNLEVIKCADYIIDLGPGSGVDGGKIVATGTPEEVAQCQEGFTAQFLREKLTK